MGINISLYDVASPTLRHHPEWDWSRYSGDREFASWCSELPMIRRTMSWDDEGMYRPADFAAWRAAIPEWEKDAPNPGRFTKMLDILEAEPTVWINFGS